MRPLVADLLRRWFAVAGGMAAYAAVIVGGFWLVPVACATTGVWVLHALMALALLVAGLATAVGWMQWQGAPPSPSPPPPRPSTASRLHLVGVLTRRTRLAAVGLLWSAVTGEGPHRTAAESAVPQRRQDMALVGVVLGIISVILVLFHWAPVFVLGPCR
jgi:hypothetical protein